MEFDTVREGAATGKVLLVTSSAAISRSYELMALALAEAARRSGASVILIGSTRLGRMVAGKLAIVAGMGVISDVRSVADDSGSVSGVRGVYAGRFTAKVSAPTPSIALVPQGAYEPRTGGPSTTEQLTLELPEPRSRTLESRPTQKTVVDLRGAKIIVSAGRGVRKKEDLELIRRLATAMGGAMGASRPLSSDLGWLGEEYHIGLTGTYVHPDLYLAVGISGQLQHVAGIKDSKVIAAINKDKLAPIFQVCDYGVVGDLYEVVPELLKLLGSG